MPEIADLSPGTEDDLARVRFFLTGDDLEERGLAGAVGSYQGDSLAGSDCKRNAIKDGEPSEMFFKLYHADHEWSLPRIARKTFWRNLHLFPLRFAKNVI